MKVNINKEVFPSEYFSGCSIDINFAGKKIDEIVQLEFMVQEQVMPIYGYNSFKFDEMVRGSRLIQGSFGINYKDKNYLKDKVKKGWSQAQREYSTNTDTEDSVDMDDEEQRDIMISKYKEKYWNAGSEDSNKQPSLYNQSSFDISINYGKQRDGKNIEFLKNGLEDIENDSTRVIIEDVYLTGNSQTIELSGQPIKEVYTFIARDIK